MKTLLTILLLAFPVLAAEGDSYWQCVVDQIHGLTDEAQTRRLLMDSLTCIGPENEAPGKGMVAAKKGQQGDVCEAFGRVDKPCQEWIGRCAGDRFACASTFDAIGKCLDRAPATATLLGAAGISGKDGMADALQNFHVRAQSCDSGAEYLEVRPSQFWQTHCNDYGEGSIGFFELSEAYYDLRNSPGIRARLLRQFASSTPDSEGWKRLISTLIALESMDADDPEERAAAAMALGRHGNFSSPILYKLILALNDSSPLVRTNAALALRTQGNRSSVVSLSLAAKLLDGGEDSKVRGAAALALREQATSFQCRAAEEQSYRMNGSEDPNDLGNGVPLCIPYKEEDHQQGMDLGDFEGVMKANSPCNTAQQPSLNAFDGISTPEQIRDFDISKNACFVGMKMTLAKTESIARLAILAAVATESDPVAKAQMISALRNLGAPQNGNSTALTMLRFDFVRDRDYRIRRAAVFALAKAGRGEPSVITELLPELMERDPSPSVRRAAIAAIAENVPLTLSGSDDAYLYYVNGMQFHDSRATDCAASAATNAISATPKGDIAGQFFSAGFSAARNFYQDHCPGSAGNGRPELLMSRPALAAQDVAPETSVFLSFGAPVSQEMIESHIQFIGPQDKKIKFTVTELKTVDQKTLVTLKPEEDWLAGQYYQIKFLDGFKASNAPEDASGYNQRSILFKTTGSKLAQKVAALMTEDPDLDVQYAAAEALIAGGESAVINFLRVRLFEDPIANRTRASRYLQSNYLKYADLIGAPVEDKAKFLGGLVRELIDYLSTEEPMPGAGEPPAATYFKSPAVLSYYEVLDHLLSKDWVTEQMKEDLNNQFDISGRAISWIEKDFPLRNYTYFERLHYGPNREKVKEILTKHFIKRLPDGAKTVEEHIYRSIWMPP